MKTKPEKKYPVFIGIRVSEPMAKALKRTSKSENLEMSELVRRALNAYLLR